MSIAELAMREHAKNLVTTIEGLLAAARNTPVTETGHRPPGAVGMTLGFQHSLDAIRAELADYLSDEPTKVEQALDAIDAHAHDCDAIPDPDADGPEAWDEARYQRASAAAYRHSARIVREAVAS